MRCPNCNSENNDGAKFCKKCRTPLNKNVVSHEKMINSMSKENSGNNTTKYIIVALIIVAVALAGAFVYLYGFNHDNSQNNQVPVQNDNKSSVDNSEPVQASQSSQSAQPQASSSMSILGGSFSTAGGLEDKTYASIFVGPEHAGENVQIQIFYSRDGSTLNNGNMVPKTVDSSGYIEVASADAYKYFPDYAEINLYDASGKLLDTQSVSLNPDSGTQTF